MGSIFSILFLPKFLFRFAFYKLFDFHPPPENGEIGKGTFWPWLLEGPEYMRPKLIFQSDICIILVQFLGIQSQFLAISFLGPQTTMIRIKYNPCTYLLVVFFDSVSVYCDKLQATNLLQGQRRQPF